MPLGEERKVILEKYGPYVRSLAATVRKQFNSQIEMDELMAYGQVGLLEAAERFDSKVGANFLTFAHYRIKGAIFDGLRKMGILKGPESRSLGMADRSNAYMGNLADRDQASNHGSTVADDVREISSAVTGLAMVFATSLEGAEGLQLSDDEAVPADEKLELEQMKGRVRAAIEKLPEKERKLLNGYYFQSKTLEEAGAEIGQSKSWASRLHARAVERLKVLLEEEDSSEDGSRRTKNGGTTGRNLSSTNRPAEGAGSGRQSGSQAGPKQVRPGDEIAGR